MDSHDQKINAEEMTEQQRVLWVVWNKVKAEECSGKSLLKLLISGTATLTE